ncbi:MAG: preprotein translocase subunit SecG [candidate division WWE3 bacterium]|nr:preprotein translocase subunit SecG [candidate division WWE3 bacterium]
MNLNLAFSITEIVLSVIITGLILIQAKGTGLARSFSGVGGFYSSKRGLEKIVFVATIVFSVVFVIVIIAHLRFK